MLRLRRCELIPLFTPLSHCHKQRQTHSLASRILFAVIVPSPLKFLIALCCLLIHALSLPQITMGYSVGIILAQCETMYELGIRCVNCTQHAPYVQWRRCRAGSTKVKNRWVGKKKKKSRFCNKQVPLTSPPPAALCVSVCWKSLTQATACAKLHRDLD